MRRVLVVVEGQTEEAFVSNILAPTMWDLQLFLTPILVGRPGHKGGNTTYQRVRRDVVALLKQDPTTYCSTMIDYYGLGEGFPGMPISVNLESIGKVNRIEQGMKADIGSEAGIHRADMRFVPYLQLHEFEGLLFSDPPACARGLGNPHLGPALQMIRDSFVTPEDINDNANTAPSKRITSLYPQYRKVLDGSLAAQSVGVTRMRQECPHFDAWLCELEALPA